jgi:hypothetical protein
MRNLSVKLSKCTRYCFSSFTGGKHAAVGDTGGRKRKLFRELEAGLGYFLEGGG